MAIINPSFEDGLQGWSADANPFFNVVSSNWAHVEDGVEAFDGTGFLRWTGDSTEVGGGGAVAYVRYFHDNKIVSTAPSRELRVTVMARVKKAPDAAGGFSAAGLGAVPYSASGTPLGELKQGGLTVVNPGDDSGWQELTLFVTQSDPEIAYYKVFVHASSRAGATFEFDFLEWEFSVGEYTEPAPPAPPPNLKNTDFEQGDTGWTKGANWSITNAPGTLFRDGSWAARWDGGNGANSEIINEFRAPVSPGRNVSAELWANVNGSGGSQGGVHSVLVWYNEAGARIGETTGNIVQGTGTTYQKSSVSGVPPVSAKFVSLGARAYRNSNPRPFFIDSASWNYVYDRAATLTSPAPGSTLLTDSIASLRVNITGTEPAVVGVSYVQNGAEIATVTSAPYGYNTPPLANGTYVFGARVNLADGTSILTNTSTVTVSAAPPVPETREFKASNAYTYLVGENFSGLTAAMPPTARVLGVELIMDYSMDVIVRAADIGVTDQSSATYNVAFDMVSGGTIEAVLMSKNGDSYTQLGNPLTTTVPIVANGFTVEEDGTSGGKRYTHLSSTSNSTATIGGEGERFGQNPEFGNIFNTRAIGLRFYPNPSSLPAYADSGEAVYRWFLNRLKLRVYFDAGSVEYYFASPDKTQVLKGSLVHSYVEKGAFSSGDATGILQLQPSLEIIDGSQTYIGAGWTIHSAYPPDASNKIGLVEDNGRSQDVGMSYNGLPDQKQVLDNRSRYQFITANFYGDVALNSIYGAHGLPRAFAYNKQFFYKIYTQPDPDKDSPRHVAYHHAHLALGYERGNVDISVVGQPYNFDGSLGASSHAVGDNVTGLLSLSGTILGVFAGKSIWGISGTTIDNFATQIISPKLGAVEYTITDMGQPVYANAYGIYTLGQTQEYGDYLGTPLSQDISPWLRPRLNRRGTSEKEVVAAWPVRSKNQYRLAFSDGYIVSMTLNGGQSSPTFSFRKYFRDAEEGTTPSSLYDYPALIPAAVSSELDEAGEERVHTADIDKSFKDAVRIEGPKVEGDAPDTYLGAEYSFVYTTEGSAPVTRFIIEGLPPGLSYNDNGELSGTPTDTGDYNVKVTVIDANGLRASLEDTIKVTAVWGLLRVRDAATTSLWLSGDPRVWPDEVLMAPIAPSPGFSTNDIGLSKFMTLPNNTGVGAMVQLPPQDGVVISSSVALNSISRMRRIGNTVFAFPAAGPVYYYKDVSETDWTPVTLPAGNLFDIVRTNSGRWISYLVNDSTSRFVYSDQSIPTVWVDGANYNQAQSNYAMATDGTDVLILATNARCYRTQDGISVVEQSSIGGAYTDSRDAAYANGIFAFVGQPGSNGHNIITTTNKGITFNRSTLPGLNSIERLDYVDGLWVASGEGTTPPSESLVYVSSDNMATWQPSSMPYEIANSGKAVCFVMR